MVIALEVPILEVSSTSLELDFMLHRH